MKVNVSVCVLVSVFAVCLLFFTGQAKAQGTDATVSGQITDPDGRIVPNVTVVLTNLNTNVPYTTQTNGEGIYRFPAIQPGIYRANVTKDGFASIVKGDIELHVQDQVSINFALKVGSVSETMTIEAGAPMVNTTDASVSTVVDQTYVKNMPLNGRSFQDLILLTPGIVTQTSQSFSAGNTHIGMSGEFSVNGQRPEENYYTVDGVSANTGATAGGNFAAGAGASGSLGASTALGTTQALVSVDELQEFRVESSTYSAEYGRTPGGQFAFQTKSGTNQWHGSAYDYLRNNFFDARDWFNDFFGVKEPSLRQNDFGGTVGGPVKIPGVYNGNDKTFFFFNYEGLRLMAPQAANLNYVPDTALRAATPGPLGQALNAFPLQNGPEVLNGGQPTGLAEFIGSWANPNSIDSTSVRFDHFLNAKTRLFFRFSNTGSQAVTRHFYLAGQETPSVKDISNYTIRTYTGGVSGILTPRFSNDLRLNYSSNENTDPEINDGFGGATPVDLAQLAGLPSGASIGVNLFFFPTTPLLAQGLQAGTQRQWNLIDTVSLSVGRHQFKFGGDYRRSTPFFVPFNPGAAYHFSSANDVVNNTPFVVASAQAQGYPLYQNFSAFAQDEWRATPRLSVSMGLRWEVNPAPGVTQGPRPYTISFVGDPNTWGLSQPGAPLWKTTWYNFAPRLGAAYIIRSTPGWETVVRGGGGVFFDSGQQLASAGMNNSPGFRAISFPGGSFSSPVKPPPLNPPSTFLATVTGFWPHLQLPYTLEWNGSLEQALGKAQTLTVSYVGARASRLLKMDQIFPPNNPTIGAFQVVANGLSSYYNSGQVQYRRRMTQGLTVLSSYTWSHCIDYNSQNYLFGYQRGNCDSDVRHNFSGAFSYDLPSAGHGRLMDALLHHWGLDDRFTARTGFPISISGNQQLDLATGQSQFSGVDFDPTKPIYVTQCFDPRPNATGPIPCPGGRGINPNAFTLPPIDPNTGNTTRLGNAPRNFVRGFGAWQMDLAMRREFPIVERMKLQFRAEAFNIFNHPNFGTIDPQLGNNTFGEAQLTLASSLGILSPIYQMGGARSLQFALKLVF